METQIKDSKKTDLMLVDPRNIVIEDNFNVRQDYGDIEGLMHSIIENGQLEPISGAKVRGEDKYLLTDGHRRMKAIMLAIEKGHNIPFVKLIVTTGNIEDRIFAMVITGVDKKALNVLEEGEAYKRLVLYTYEPKEIAQKVGKSVAHIYNMLKLAEAPKEVKTAIENNEISGSTVVRIMREVNTPDDLITSIKTAVNDAKKGGVTKKATAKNVSKLKTPFQKLLEAAAIAEDKNGINSELLYRLTVEMGKKDSTPETIANLFL
jgi:ParB family transcriptional regulator, chromosome partitioning protein